MAALACSARVTPLTGSKLAVTGARVRIELAARAGFARVSGSVWLRSCSGHVSHDWAALTVWQQELVPPWAPLPTQLCQRSGAPHVPPPHRAGDLEAEGTRFCY